MVYCLVCFRECIGDELVQLRIVDVVSKKPLTARLRSHNVQMGGEEEEDSSHIYIHYQKVVVPFPPLLLNGAAMMVGQKSAFDLVCATKKLNVS